MKFKCFLQLIRITFSAELYNTSDINVEAGVKKKIQFGGLDYRRLSKFYNEKMSSLIRNGFTSITQPEGEMKITQVNKVTLNANCINNNYFEQLLD